MTVKDNYFKEDLEAVIKIMAKKKSKAVAWNLLNSNVIKADLTTTSFRIGKKEIHFSVSKGSSYYFQQLITGLGKINLFIPEFSVIFICDLADYKDGKIILKFPSQVYSYERRKNKRVQFLDKGVDIFFFEDRKVITKECHDLGIGGASIVCSKREKRIFEINQEKKINLHIGKKIIKVKAKVLKLMDVGPFSLKKYLYGGTRISIEFVSLSSANQKIIKDYIIDHENNFHKVK